MRAVPNIAWPARAESEPCIEWHGTRNREGYGVTHAGKPRRQLRAHRVAYEREFGAIPAGLMVCHRCDNRACVNPSHLFVGTAADNNADRDAKGRGARLRGSTNPASKLSEVDVSDIRVLRAFGVSQKRIAREYGVRQSLVSAIDHGHIWQHV